jgi:hypothetical protein
VSRYFLKSFSQPNVHCSSRCPGFDYSHRKIFWNVVLKKDRDAQLDRSCEKRISATRVREERQFLLIIKRRMANWIGNTLRRNFLPKHVTEQKIEGMGRRGRRRKELLDDFKETRRYWSDTERGRTLCRISFGGGYGRVVSQTTRWRHTANTVIVRHGFPLYVRTTFHRPNNKLK